MIVSHALSGIPKNHVVPARLARLDKLIAGTAAHRLLPDLTGFSVQSAPRVSIEERARRSVSQPTDQRHSPHSTAPWLRTGVPNAKARRVSSDGPSAGSAAAGHGTIASGLFTHVINPHSVP
jgi:hypothetical protein